MPIFPKADLTVDEILLRTLYGDDDDGGGGDDDVAVGFFPSVSLLPSRPSPFCLAYFPVRENYFFFTCHVKYNVDITPACYSNPLIFMSYNSRAPRKSGGLLKLFHRMILSPSLVVYTPATKPMEPYPLLMAAGICDI